MQKARWMGVVTAILAVAAFGATASPAAASQVPVPAAVTSNNLVITQNPTTGQISLQGLVLQASQPVNISVSSAFPGGDVEVYKPLNGVSQTAIDQNLLAAGTGSTDPDGAKAAIAWFRYNTEIDGGLSTTPGSVNYKRTLPPGKYYVGQFHPVANPADPSKLLLPSNTAKSFVIVGTPQATLPYAPQKISMNDVNGDKFIVDSVDGKLHTGQLLKIYNTSSELHFAQFVQMKPGTTMDDVAAWLAGGANPALEGGGTLYFGTQTPQGASIVTFNVPAGLYLVIDWIPSAKTGLPHALPPINMYKLVDVV